MDETLKARYQEIFSAYGAGATGVLPEVKRRIIEWNEAHERKLRSDAALFLVVNLDLMLIRPYGGTFGNLPPFKRIPLEEVPARTRDFLELILEDLAKKKGGISSHEVMGSVDSIWGKAVNVLAWG